MADHPDAGDAEDASGTHELPDWLGLQADGPGQWSFELAAHLTRIDGRFYGGTGMAVATAAMEAVTGRRAVWVSLQFVSSGTVGDRFECRVEVLAEGRNASQVRMTGWRGERLAFSGMGAAVERRSGPIEATFGTFPAVPPPDACPPWTPRGPRIRPGEHAGWLEVVDGRLADEKGAIWMRLRDRPLSRAALPFLSDIVPSGVMRAAGRAGFGTSLDNTVRFGPEVSGDWLLVDIEPHMISGGYLHGAARLWAEDGTLVAVASQTAGVMLFD